MNRTLREWLIILVSLLDDAIFILLVVGVLWLLRIPVTPVIFVFLVVLFIVSALVSLKLLVPAIRRRVVIGLEALAGKEAVVVQPLRPEGMVFIEGEYWDAVSLDGEISAGKKVSLNWKMFRLPSTGKNWRDST